MAWWTWERPNLSPLVVFAWGAALAPLLPQTPENPAHRPYSGKRIAQEAGFIKKWKFFLNSSLYQTLPLDPGFSRPLIWFRSRQVIRKFRRTLVLWECENLPTYKLRTASLVWLNNWSWENTHIFPWNSEDIRFSFIIHICRKVCCRFAYSFVVIDVCE